jgi:peptide deformylase
MTMNRSHIISLPDPRLRETSKRIGHVDDSTRTLAEDMIRATLDWERSRDHELGAALAAVQVGILLRMVVIRNDFDDPDDNSFAVFINPEIVKVEGVPTSDIEGCLSVAGIYGRVPRYPKVKIKALNLNGEPVRVTATGFLARVFQHEIDHTKGTVFVDHVTDARDLFRMDSQGEFRPLGADQAPGLLSGQNPHV